MSLVKPYGWSFQVAGVPDLMPTRPGRNVQVATSLYTLDHNQQDRKAISDTDASSCADARFRPVATYAEGVAATKLDTRALDIPSRLIRSVPYPLSRVESHSAQKGDPKDWLSHQLGNAALPALQL